MKNVRVQAERDLEAFVKMGIARGPEANKIRWDYIKQLAGPLLGTLAAMGTAGYASYLFSKKDEERHRQDLTNSMKSLYTRSPAFAKDPAKFAERFGELTVISPTIAKNPGLASKIIEKRLKPGFSVDDVHKLTSIEHNTSTSHRLPSPAASARASAYGALQTLVSTFGPQELQRLRHESLKARSGLSVIEADQEKKLDAEADDLAKSLGGLMQEAFAEKGLIPPQEGHEKKSAARAVSDECLGQMLAERYVLLKTAGLGNILGEGAKNMGRGLAYFAPAIALGGGIELARQVMESRRNKALEQQADKNFAQLIRSSDDLRTPENKELAQEAFQTLKAVAPSLAARPLVAKTFIEYTTRQGVLAPETVQQLAEAENRVRGIAGKGGFVNDLKFTMGLADPKKLPSIASKVTSRSRI